MDVSLSANNKEINAVPKPGNQWKGVYSSAGYVKAEGLDLLLSGETMNVEHQRRALPSQDCHGYQKKVDFWTHAMAPCRQPSLNHQYTCYEYSSGTMHCIIVEILCSGLN
jgi:hypothetical protein